MATGAGYGQARPVGPTSPPCSSCELLTRQGHQCSVGPAERPDYESYSSQGDNVQGLICEGTTEDSVRLSDGIRLVDDLSPRQVRVEIHAAGVCGSDMSCIHGKYYMPTPLIPGHEAAGKVVEVGSAVTYCEVGDLSLIHI